MGPTDRRGLRNCPELGGAMAAEVPGVHVDGQIRQRSPEVHERDAVSVVGAEALVEYIDGPVDDDIVGGEAEARHGGVVATLNVGGICLLSIRPPPDPQPIALL